MYSVLSCLSPIIQKCTVILSSVTHCILTHWKWRSGEKLTQSRLNLDRVQMLPLPVNSGTRKNFSRLVSRRTLTDTLLSRSRFTNCAVTLLIILTSFSLYHNLRFWLSSNSIFSQPGLCRASTTPSDQKYSTKFGSSWWATVTHPPNTENLEHLIIVPGHAIWIGNDPGQRLDESQWVLEPYQKGRARLEALYQHIQRG